jgi:hypothetical protein
MDNVSIRSRGPTYISTDSSRDQDNPRPVYTEERIDQIARDLGANGRTAWSKVPRLYIITQAIVQISEIGQSQLLNCLIKNGVNDTWLPIASEDMLEEILPSHLHHSFQEFQNLVCIRPSDYQLHPKVTHGNFATEKCPPFESLREVGRGHIGKVDEVRNRANGKIYARKRIRRLSDLKITRSRIQGFLRELHALRRMNHRHCVQIVRPSVQNPLLSRPSDGLSFSLTKLLPP